MCLTEESKKHIKKKWNRLTSSIWTKLFAIIFFIQFFIVIFFQVRVLIRNSSIYNDDDFVKSYRCDKNGEDDESSQYLFVFSALQSVIFMVIQLFLIYFGLNAIFHEHIIQIITLVVLNFGSAAYSLVQLLQIKIRVDRIKNNKACSEGAGFKTDWLAVDLPQVLTLSVISIISAYIASKLYKQFGWSVYKRIGGDLKIQRIYRNNLIFLMLLKLNLFFWLLYIIPTIIIAVKITDFTNNGIVDKILIIYHSCATVLALILQILAYKSIKVESRMGMIIFTILWLFIVIDYGLLIYVFIRLLVLGSYFLLIFTGVFVLIGLATFIYSIIVTVNFGRGLKEIIEKHKKIAKTGRLDVPKLNIPPGPSSSSAYSPASSTSQQFPPISPLSDKLSSIEKQDEEEARWTIDD